MSSFQPLQIAHHPVVFSVADLRMIEYIVLMFVVAEGASQSLYFSEDGIGLHTGLHLHGIMISDGPASYLPLSKGISDL
jgi:hypothetical protein